MSIFDDVADIATGVDAAPAAGAESADPGSPTEPGATEQPAAEPTSSPATGNVPEARPTDVAEQPGAPEAAAAVVPPEKVEEELDQLQSQLPANAGTAFAKFRTENRTLTQEVERLRTENEGLQTPPGGAILIDAPADEWDPIPQLEKMPEGHYLKLAHTLTDFHLPERIGSVLEKYDTLPEAAQKSIANAFSAQMERELGLTTAQVWDICEAYKKGNVPGSQQPANASAPNSAAIPYSQRLIDDHLFAPNDPLVLEAQANERAHSALLQEVTGLKQQFSGQQTTYEQGQKARVEDEGRAREQEFQSKKSAVQTSVLDPIRKAIPAGYEQSYTHVEAAALRAIEQDPVAQTHLTNAKAALERAAKYTAEGTPQFATREMQRHAGEMAKYAALFGIKAQAEAKYQTGLVAENVAFKNRTTNPAGQRREVIGAAATATGQNGRPQREPNEDADDFAKRTRSYLIGRLEQQQAPGPSGR
jgi:hypothetical protein